MTLHSKRHDNPDFADRLCDIHAPTARFIAEIVKQTRQRLPPIRRIEKTVRIERLIAAGACADAALALIDLELPQWRLSRIAYDDGEWSCALSRQRELPDWLDQSVEARHADLALAILSAFLDAQSATAPRVQTSVPFVPLGPGISHIPFPCDNFA